MSEDKQISELQSSINELKQLILSINNKSEISLKKENQIDNLFFSLVDLFYQILSNFFLSGKKYWEFISKHVNRPVTMFCKINEKNNIEFEDYENKGKNWLLISILEKSFSETIKDIINHLEYNNNYNNDFTETIFDIFKKDVIPIIDELNYLQFNNIYNEDYENYLVFLKENGFIEKPSIKINNISTFSPIPGQERDLEEINENNGDNASIFFDIEKLKPIDLKIETLEKIMEERNKKENDNELFKFKKYGDFKFSIVENFYNFIPKVKSLEKISEEDKNSNIIINSEINEEFLQREGELRRNSGLILYNERNYSNLPSDELYQIKGDNYSKNDEFIYNRKKKRISNSHLLYINFFHKKARYYKFYVSNTHEKSITLKQQNYQCFNCLKKFSTLLGFPIEPIFWCSYYMRYVCKNCIASDYSIIPQLILKEWCFEKFPISKKAKAFIESWYDKPIIYLKKKDKLMKHFPNDIFRIKKDINNIFDYMKCEDAFDFLEQKIPDRKYIVLKENIFSLKDLMEIYNETFIKKLKAIKEMFISHIRNECDSCKYEGDLCINCLNEDKINFYDSEEINYCRKCFKSFHKKCINLIEGHNTHICVSNIHNNI